MWLVRLDFHDADAIFMIRQCDYTTVLILLYSLGDEGVLLEPVRGSSIYKGAIKRDRRIAGEGDARHPDLFQQCFL